MTTIKRLAVDAQKQMKAIAKANVRPDITTGEAASICICSKQTIINYLDKGDILFTRMGSGPRRVSVESLRSFLINSGRTVTGFTDVESSSNLADLHGALKGITDETARKILKNIIPVFNDKSKGPKEKLKGIVKIIQGK